MGTTPFIVIARDIFEIHNNIALFTQSAANSLDSRPIIQRSVDNLEQKEQRKERTEKNAIRTIAVHQFNYEISHEVN
jgi:hypothetical protein